MILWQLSISISPPPSRSQNQRHIYTSHTCLMRPQYTSCAEHWEVQERLFTAEERKASQFLTLTSLPTMVHTPPPPSNMAKDATHSPFLRLPTEIRLQIYTLLVLPRKPTDMLPIFERVQSSSQDYYDYDQWHHDYDRPALADPHNLTLLIRTIDGTRYPQRYGPNTPRGPHLRTSYSVRADRFRARTMHTTYQCVNVPRIEDHLGILAASKQIHAEAAELLYSAYTFDFDTHVEAIIPFLSDLTPFARSCVKSIRFVKRALAYEKEFDRAEWSSAMRYLTSSSSNINLRRLELGIVAGRPGPSGWDRIAKYSVQDFRLLREADGMQWLQYLLEIKGLQELDVSAIVEHCPPATNSMAMAGFIRFSASVESGFAQFLREQMVLARGVV